jgi:hypothetical protein
MNWGDPETTDVASLAAGDFVVRFPPAGRWRGCDVNSGVAALDWDYGPWPQRNSRREILRVITFLDRTVVTVAVQLDVIARRRTESSEAAA